jgi:hypothetical protein
LADQYLMRSVTRASSSPTAKAASMNRGRLLHALPDRFHRIRHYGFLANHGRAAKLALCRHLLAVAASLGDGESQQPDRRPDVCPSCGGHMEPIGWLPRSRPASSSDWHDSS